MINFLSREDAGAGFGHSQSEYGAQFCTKIATIGYFSEVREWAKNSRTAQALIKFVEESDVVINFIGMHGGFQCFDESADNRLSGKAEPTIYIDVRGRLGVYVRTPHQTREELHAPRPRNAPLSPFDNRIALLHELGHAKQFIERPGWYRTYTSSQKKAEFRDALEGKAKQVWTRKLSGPPAVSTPVAIPSGGPPPAPGGAPPAPGGPPPGPGLPGAAGGLKQKLDAILPKPSERAKSQSWFVVIDIDNMQRHEWPICTELGLPIRLNYTDLSA